MGTLTVPSGGTVYLDANCVVYRVERVEPYAAALAPVFDRAEQGAIALATSELTLLECLVKPRRERAVELESLFRSVLCGSRDMRLVPITAGVLETALRIRADHGLKTPDAIHAASAIESGCEVFYTNDQAFRRVPGLRVEVLRDAVG